MSRFLPELKRLLRISDEEALADVLQTIYYLSSSVDNAIHKIHGFRDGGFFERVVELLSHTSDIVKVCTISQNTHPILARADCFHDIYSFFFLVDGSASHRQHPHG